MVWAGVCEGKKSEVRREHAGLVWESARDLLWNSGARENCWSKSPGKWCVVHLVWLRSMLNWISWGMGAKPWEVLLGFCLGPGLGQPSWAPHWSEIFLLSYIYTAVISYLSSLFWALHSVLEMNEFTDWEGFIAIIRIETFNIFTSVHTFGHGCLSLHLSQRSTCLFLTASACWADVFRELSAATPRSFSCVVTINLKFSNV